MTNQEEIAYLTAQLEKSKEKRRAIEEANTVKSDFPKHKRKAYKYHGNRFVARVEIK